MPPAATINKYHTCPMVDPTEPPIPHVGGNIIGPGVDTVFIGGEPASVVGDEAFCEGPPDTIIEGSLSVYIGGRPAARMGDATEHGGEIVDGVFTVNIGD